MTDAQSTLTRATTASRKSTIASRNASLIKKNTGPNELRPSDILIERFTGTWLGGGAAVLGDGAIAGAPLISRTD